MENIGIKGIVYFDGQFKTGIPERLHSLFPFHSKKDQRSLFLLNAFYL